MLNRQDERFTLSEEAESQAVAPPPASQRFALSRLFGGGQQRQASMGSVVWHLSDGGWAVMDAPYNRIRLSQRPPDGSLVARSSIDAFYRLQKMNQIPGMTPEQWEEFVRGEFERLG